MWARSSVAKHLTSKPPGLTNKIKDLIEICSAQKARDVSRNNTWDNMSQASAPRVMATFKDTVMIKDRPYDRAVEVTVIAPDDMNVTNVQELAEKAWRSVNKTITIGKVTLNYKDTKASR
jgi:hypothetical protein